MSRGQRAILLALLAVVAVGLSSWPSSAPSSPPAPRALQGADAPGAGDRAELSPATASGRDDALSGGATRQRATTPAGRARPFTVTVHGEAPAAPGGLQVALLFGPRLETSLRLRVGSRGAATWTSGDGEAWPRVVDFAFPTLGNGAAVVGEDPRAELTLPPTCTVELEVRELDGLPATEPMSATVRVPGARPPADRPHPVEVTDGRGAVTAEAAGQLLEVEVRTASGRAARGTYWAASDGGGAVTCPLQLTAEGGVPVRVADLPQGDETWRVDVYASAASGPVRAPRAGDGYLAFCPGGRVEDGAFVLASRGVERRWGLLRGGIASTAPEAEVARGRVVDDAGQGVVGVLVELFARLDAGGLGGRIASARTDVDGGFVVLGPAPSDVPSALRVATTEEVVDLPRAAPLLLRATRWR